MTKFFVKSNAITPFYLIFTFHAPPCRHAPSVRQPDDGQVKATRKAEVFCFKLLSSTRKTVKKLTVDISANREPKEGEGQSLG